MTDLVERGSRAAAPPLTPGPIPAPDPAPVSDGRRSQVAHVADTLIDLVRNVNKTRARVLAHAALHDVEWSAHLVLRCIDTDGPMRAGALAGCLQSDPSTVSRQVAAMVKDGLLERRADPDDGRASLLVLTDRAREVLADYDAYRIAHFTELVADWTDQDLERFATDLDRFTGDYHAAVATVIDRLVDTTGTDDSGSPR